jgi:IS30 family transposase
MLFFYLPKRKNYMKYKQLTLTKRYHILSLIKEGYKQKDIAKEIGVLE